MAFPTSNDDNAALNHVKNLEFRRLASTKGETKAVNYITKELDFNNIPHELESFEWSKSTTYLMKGAFLFLLIYISLYQWILFFSGYIWIIIVLDVFLILAIYLGMKYLLDMSKIIHVGRKSQSDNIITKIPSKKESPKRPLIILSAHYDSVSVKYPYKLQLGLYIVAGVLSLGYLILTLMLSVWSFLAIFNLTLFNEAFFIIRLFTWICGTIIMIDLIMLILNSKTNESTGSIDNATGVSILIELAKKFNSKPLKNTDVLVLWCGAEEWGLWGSKQFCAKHFDELIETNAIDKSFNLNIDMVGTYIGIVDKTGMIKRNPLNKTLNDVLYSVAKNQKIEIEKSFIPIGAGSDHMSFKSFAKQRKVNLEVTCFLSHKDGKYIHSSKDKSDLCSAEILNDCIELVHDAIRSLDLRME